MSTIKFYDCSPIFVVGASRSGTTLLQMMFNAHPNIAIMGELHYFDEILQIREQLPSFQGPEDIDSFFSLVKKAKAIGHLPGIEPIFEAVKERMKNDRGSTYEAFYKYVLEEHAKIKGATRFGEKTLTNIRYMEGIIDLFSKSKILHIIRDPRDVVASCLKVPWIADDIVANSLKWKSGVF